MWKFILMQGEVVVLLDENCKMIKGSNDKPLWKWINDGCYAFDENGKFMNLKKVSILSEEDNIKKLH
jgi:hypothetical protein